MHKRKKYIVYPPDYADDGNYMVCSSKYQALKKAFKLGVGAQVFYRIDHYAKKHMMWVSSSGMHYMYEVESNIVYQ